MTSTSATYALISFSVEKGLQLLMLGKAVAVDVAGLEAIQRGVVADSTMVLPPEERSTFYSASQNPGAVTLIGSPTTGWKVYGPFAKVTDADDFGGTCAGDDEYLVLPLLP